MCTDTSVHDEKNQRNTIQEGKGGEMEEGKETEEDRERKKEGKVGNRALSGHKRQPS